jgi:hypothetical protein
MLDSCLSLDAFLSQEEIHCFFEYDDSQMGLLASCGISPNITHKKPFISTQKKMVIYD